MKYTLPKATAVSEVVYFRGTRYDYIPETKIDEYNEKVAERFADFLATYEEENGESFPVEEYEELFYDISTDTAIEYTVEGEIEVDDVLDVEFEPETEDGEWPRIIIEE